MPHVVRPQVAIPEDVATAVETVKSQLRVEAMRVLRTSGRPHTGRQLALAIGVEYERAFQRHLTALEEIGVIVGAPPVGERQGQLVHYTLNADVLNRLLTALTRHLQGDST